MEWLLLWAIMAAIAGMIAGSKGRNALPWFLYGFAIWPIAIVHALLLEKEQPPPEPQRTLPMEPPKTPYGEPRIPYMPSAASPAWPREPAQPIAKPDLRAPLPAMPQSDQALVEIAALRLICGALAVRTVQLSPDPAASLVQTTSLLRLAAQGATIDGIADPASVKATVKDTTEGVIAVMTILASAMFPGVAVEGRVSNGSDTRIERDTFDILTARDIEIVYVSGGGTETTRRVTVESYGVPISAADGRPDILSGRCHLREELRTFRVDRVQSAVELVDGEVIADLGAWLLERKARRRPRDLDK